MSGNVMEWTSQDSELGEKLICGSDLGMVKPSLLSSDCQWRDAPETRNSTLGVRCARASEEEAQKGDEEGVVSNQAEEAPTDEHEEKAQPATEKKKTKKEVKEEAARQKAVLAYADNVPERISALHIQTEGDGFIGYFALSTSQDEPSVSSGQLTLTINLTSRGMLVEKEYYYTGEIRAEDYREATIGLGVFARGAIVYRLPYVKWSDFLGRMVSLAGPRGFDNTYAYQATVRLVTDDGIVLESSTDFRP
ncbi:MAG: hypothetical protein M0R80_12395 [Proteobacteria bacterium]|jgi:hypothetical protein|nr:hypothetical protein [Pseudomonadota bacterium]